MPDFNFVPGIYRVDNPEGLLVRGTTDHTNPNNIILNNGRQVKMQAGQAFPVFDIKYTSGGEWWAVLSPPDAPNEHYSCLWDGKKQYAHMETASQNPNGPQINPVWVMQVDQYIRTHGLSFLVNPFI